MTLSYGERWSLDRLRFNVPFTPEKAKKEHDKKRLYTALIEGGPEGAVVVVEMCFTHFTHCHVAFLDEQKREVLVYSFTPATGGRLFLSQTIERFYEGDSRSASYGKITKYEEDGSVRVREGKAGSGHGNRDTVNEFKTTLDPRIHYEPIPEFGRYESITRRDRTQPPPSAA